ncbi:MAG TPA: alpha/beta fold hydrolase [Vicinamibacterales bacterium]|nr:alpha/beta fold hydrolase [Vicinamibacterales bacterium]
MLRLIYLVAAGAALVYVGLLVGLWHYQEHVLFQPPRWVPDEPVAARRVSYPAADGVELFGYLVGDCAAPGTTVVAFHGNADISRWYVPWAARLARETGACVMLPEYRGYDGIAGGPTYATSALDAKAATDFLARAHGIAPSNVVLYGHSLGSAVAAELAARQAPRALVLQSPLSTAQAMAARLGVPGITRLWWLISRIHFDTPARVRSLASPVWVAHGDRDRVVPVRMGREVFAAAADKGELLVVQGAGHNDVAEVGAGAYWSWLVRAINSGTAVASTATRDAVAGK